MEEEDLLPLVVSESSLDVVVSSVVSLCFLLSTLDGVVTVLLLAPPLEGDEKSVGGGTGAGTGRMFSPSFFTTGARIWLERDALEYF